MTAIAFTLSEMPAMRLIRQAMAQSILLMPSANMKSRLDNM